MSYHSKGISKNKEIKQQRKFPIVLMNRTIERDEVLNPCLTLCKKLEISGYILQYRRLDVFDKTHIKGSPDIEIWIAYEGYILLFMVECKKSKGGIQSDVQSAYEEKYKPFKNVHYQIITSPEQLKNFIMKLSDTKIYDKSFNDFQCEPSFKPGDDI